MRIYSGQCECYSIIHFVVLQPILRIFLLAILVKIILIICRLIINYINARIVTASKFKMTECGGDDKIGNLNLRADVAAGGLMECTDI